MDPIQAAIEEIESRGPEEGFSYKKIAAKYNIQRSTLSRRHQGLTSSNQTKKLNQTKLSPQQEDELVQYIKTLTERGLPPTREMIRNSASQVAHETIS